MKKLPIKSKHFIYLEKSFGEWLDVLGYSQSEALPLKSRELFHYLEQRGCTKIEQIDTSLVTAYYAQLSTRKNEKRDGCLTNGSLNIHLHALDKLFEFLRHKAKMVLPAIPINKEAPDTKPVVPLTAKQVQNLYEATRSYEGLQPVVAQRDRAILAVFYDCGLRRNEGVMLNIDDINLDSRALHVRYAKGGKQRFVPFGKATRIHLMDYRFEARPKLTHPDHPNNAFFLSRNGQRADGQLLSDRLKHMQSQSDDPDLKHLNLHLHLLRHSIATHLLFQGLTLEKVAQFLGHKSLSSTQIYTHLMEEVYGVKHPDATPKQPFNHLKKCDLSHGVKLADDE